MPSGGARAKAGRMPDPRPRRSSNGRADCSPCPRTDTSARTRSFPPARRFVQGRGPSDAKAHHLCRYSDSASLTLQGLHMNVEELAAVSQTRGPVYTSAEKAGLSAKTGKKYHPHCGCTVEVVYGDWKPTEQEQQWIDDYYRAAESLPGKTPRTWDRILPLMRQTGGYRDSASHRSSPEFLSQRRRTYARKRAAELERCRKELDKALSIRGKPMSIDKADQSNTNPRFSTQYGYQINCQS